jgi:AraC-like DNA-binding protein
MIFGMDMSNPDLTFNDKSRLPGMLDDIDVRLLWAQRDDLEPGAWNHERLANDFWRIYQNDRAGGVLICNGQDIPLEADAIYIIPAGLTLSSRNAEYFRQFFIHFDLRGVPPVVFHELFPAPARVPDTPVFTASLSAVAERIVALGPGDVAVQCLLKGIVYEAFGHYFSTVAAEQVERCWLRMAALQEIAPALDTIHDRLRERIRNDELARLCNLSEDYFIQRFKNAVGMTPLSYIQKRRVAAAAQQLLFTNQSIDAIAEQTGFGDRFYFSRIFTRETGRPPAAYRRGPRI